MSELAINNNRFRINRILVQDKVPVFLWFLFFLVMWYMASRCETLEAFDLHRYYEDAISTQNDSLRGIIEDNRSRAGDFIYFVVLHWALKLGIPLNLVTGLIVTISFATIISCMREIYRGEMEWYVLYGVLFLAPISWIIEIARNMMAFMFIFISIKQYYKRRWILAVVFSILGVLTHFSSLMYVAVLLLCVFIQKLRINKYLIFIIIAGFLTASYLMPSYLLDLLSIVLSGGDTVFSTQYGAMDSKGITTWTDVGTADIVAVVFSLVYSIILLVKNKSQGYEFWSLLVVTAMLSFFLSSSQMLTNRCMMIMPMLWGLNVARIYQTSIKKDISVLKIVSVFCVVLALWHLFSYRDMYFPLFF